MAKAKYEYVVETPHGTFTRSSNKVYTHIVVSVGELTHFVNADGSTTPHDPKPHGPLDEWCGRPDLAEKLARKYTGGKTSWGVPFRGRAYIYPVTVK